MNIQQENTLSATATLPPKLQRIYVSNILNKLKKSCNFLMSCHLTCIHLSTLSQPVLFNHYLN